MDSFKFEMTEVKIRNVGLRNFYDVSKDELEPNEKSTFKIYEYAGELPKTDFVVKAEGSDYTNVEVVSIEEQIEGINNITKALKSIPTEVVTTITENENGIKEIGSKTVTYADIYKN
jgi:ribosomal protein S3AE